MLGLYQFMLVLLINSLMGVLDFNHLAAVGWRDAFSKKAISKTFRVYYFFL
jgi:hypothetical protein